MGKPTEPPTFHPRLRRFPVPGTAAETRWFSNLGTLSQGSGKRGGQTTRNQLKAVSRSLTGRKTFLCGPLEKWDRSSKNPFFPLDFTPCPEHRLGALNPMAHIRIYPKKQRGFWGENTFPWNSDFLIRPQAEISVFGV